MERFGPALRRAAAELDLPDRIRSELLLEMASDLEAVYNHLLDRGLTEDEAARRAEATVLASPAVIRSLGRMHASPWRSCMREVGVRWTGVLGFVLLMIGVLPIVVLGGGLSFWVMAAAPSPLSWLILLVTALMITLSATEVVRLLNKRPLRRPRLPALLVLVAMAPAFGLLAPVLGIQGLSTGLAGAPPETSALLATVVRDGATLLAGLLVGIGGLLTWFALLELEARRASREVATLLENNSPIPKDRESEPDGIVPLVRRRHG